jgi:Protein of unknown function with HXXEE motif
MSTRDESHAMPVAGPWAWLFPVTYAAHMIEEGFAGERFYRWIARVIGRQVSGRAFAAVNLTFEAAMAFAVYSARRRPGDGWVVPMLGTITAANGAGHLVGSLATRSYSPGLVSGVALWTPLGTFALLRSRRELPRALWRRGVLAGAAANAGVGFLALGISRPAS